MGSGSSVKPAAPPAPVPDLLGGNLFTPAPAPALVPVAASTAVPNGQLGNFFASPAAFTAPTNGGANVGLDSFDPRGGSSSAATGGFGHDFSDFTGAGASAAVPVAAPAVRSLVEVFPAVVWRLFFLTLFLVLGAPVVGVKNERKHPRWGFGRFGSFGLVRLS